MATRLLRTRDALARIREVLPTYHEQTFHHHVRKGNIAIFATMSWRPGKTANLYHPDDVEAFIAKLKAGRGL